MYMPSVATTFAPSTSSIGYQQQPPSWADVEPIAPQQPQQQVNDIFTGVTYFDVNEKPAQVHQPRNTAQSVMYTQMVQHVPHSDYVRSKRHVQFPAPIAQRRNTQFDQYIVEKFRRGSLEERSSDSSSSEDLSGSSSPYQHNGTTYFQVPATFPSRHRSPSELRPTCLSELDLYALVSKFKASQDQLEKNGYPLYQNGETKRATVMDTKYTERKKMWRSPEDRMRTCVKCEVDFELKSNGKMSECVYHTKKTVFDEVKGYVRQCCGEADGLTEGCEMRRSHVFDQLLITELDQFLRTEKEYGLYDARSFNILAIDCEMVYTVSGPALARLSVVDWHGQLIMDVMVRPPTQVIDPNTEYSGLTMDDIHLAKDTLESCREKLFSLVNEKTILVGHSLESDLKALRVVHTNVVDTSLLYITKKGFKVGLKKLASSHLGLKIQANNPTACGHDSAEDARVSLDLLKFWMRMNR